MQLDRGQTRVALNNGRIRLHSKWCMDVSVTPDETRQRFSIHCYMRTILIDVVDRWLQSTSFSITFSVGSTFLSCQRAFSENLMVSTFDVRSGESLPCRSSSLLLIVAFSDWDSRVWVQVMKSVSSATDIRYMQCTDGCKVKTPALLLFLLQRSNILQGRCLVVLHGGVLSVV